MTTATIMWTPVADPLPELGEDRLFERRGELVPGGLLDQLRAGLQVRGKHDADGPFGVPADSYDLAAEWGPAAGGCFRGGRCIRSGIFRPVIQDA